MWHLNGFVYKRISFVLLIVSGIYNFDYRWIVMIDVICMVSAEL